MNWSMLAAFAGFGAMLFSVGGALIVYGRTTQRIDQNEEAVIDLRRDHGGRLDGHDVKIGELEIQAAETAGWRKGYDAGRASV